jgi:hypothetical protein
MTNLSERDQKPFLEGCRKPLYRRYAPFLRISFKGHYHHVKHKSRVVGQFFKNSSREGTEPIYRGVEHYSVKPFSSKEVQCKHFLKGMETMTFFTVYPGNLFSLQLEDNLTQNNKLSSAPGYLRFTKLITA